ncbi:MAG: folate family ECF transporter S component [Atribacterota bacterium]|nr:folate family ECF transporter S component [Atribacterota bacterium]MDD4896603.1 folate family ECF transporter S component [Atribacterota bacterium]MDD5637400.1 folate family ECF transporter S component [Atribacterota bacterium]
MNISTRNISLVSILVAMSIILSRIASIRIAVGGVEGIRIGFGKLPIILGSFIMGPFYGGLIGAISDFLGYLIQPIGPYIPHFTVISALCGILPVVLFRMLRGNEEHIINILIPVGITVSITELFLISYSLHIIFAIPWQILMIPRLISVPITIIIYSYLIHAFIRRKVVQVAHH